MVNYSLGGGVTHYRNMYSIRHSPFLIIAHTLDLIEGLRYGEAHSNWRTPQNPSGIAKGGKTGIEDLSQKLPSLTHRIWETLRLWIITKRVRLYHPSLLSFEQTH